MTKYETGLTAHFSMDISTWCILRKLGVHMNISEGWRPSISERLNEGHIPTPFHQEQDHSPAMNHRHTTPRADNASGRILLDQGSTFHYHDLRAQSPIIKATCQYADDAYEVQPEEQICQATGHNLKKDIK